MFSTGMSRFTSILKLRGLTCIALHELINLNCLGLSHVRFSLQCNRPLLLCRFIRVGGYRLLNSWLTYSKTTNNTPLLQLILLTLQKLPLKVDHLKQVQFIQIYSLLFNPHWQQLHLFSPFYFTEQHGQTGEAAEQKRRYRR